METFCPANQNDWRSWLEKNHVAKSSIWLIIYKKNSDKPNISWSEAVDEALCFGWIDSLKKPIDAKSYKQYFSKRKEKSIWSKINKEKVGQLIGNGKMTKAGLKSVEIAKQNGSWAILDEVDAMTIPNDLEEELKKRPGSLDYFSSLSNSVKKGLLYWIISAKRRETRNKRILEIAENAVQRRKPAQFR